MNYLAGPALHGRGSGTEDEHKAAEFIAAKLKSYGLQPAAGDGQYIQVGTLRSREVVGNPTLTVETKGEGNQKPLVLTHRKEIVMSGLSQGQLTAPLQKIDLDDPKASDNDIAKGAALLVRLKAGTSMEDARKLLEPYRSGNAAMVVVASSAYAARMFEMLAKEPPRTPQLMGSEEPKPRALLVLAKQETFERLWAEPSETSVTLKAQLSPWKTAHTWNVLGKIDGTTDKDQVVLLSAHLDHLGVKEGETYYGADDDASGTVAVMELARLLAKDPKPKRTVVVALWGSEETGMVGSRYFLQSPTFPLKDIVANLEFEMIGRPDPKLKPDELWLTGWERTNLGPELARHGALLVADERPAEKFFTRSDNYALAEKGVVAQTVSSYGLHPDYHQPTDTLDKIDFQHMDRAISSMLGPITWLSNTDFTPEWVEGKKP
jgi:peptidase M28-like protein